MKINKKAPRGRGLFIFKLTYKEILRDPSMSNHGDTRRAKNPFIVNN